MTRYIIRRLLASIPVIVLVGVIVFSMLHLAPGDPAAILAGDDPSAYNPEHLAEIREKLGLERPIIVQFGSWGWRLLRGDLGESFYLGRSIASLIKPRLEPTLGLAAMALIMSVLVGVPLGVVAAWQAHKLPDRAIMMFAVLGFSVPVFWFGFILMWVFSVNLGWFRALGYSPLSDGIYLYLKGLFLPAFTIAVVQIALIARMTRSSMLDVLDEDYIRTARAKGLAERDVLLRHAFKAASIPVVTVIGLVLAGLISGVVIVEIVFSIPGMGRLVVDAIARRDYPVIQGTLIAVAGVYIFVNLIVDVIYGYLDPRIRY